MAKLPDDFGPMHPDWKMPSKRNRWFREQAGEIGTDGKLCVFTVVSGDYQWYAPLFVYQAQRAYPDADIKILLRGERTLHSDLMGCVAEIDAGEYSDRWHERVPGWTTAALRFAHFDSLLADYDYVLITDVDMMHRAETPSMVEQRLVDMLQHELRCYSNYVSSNVDGGPRLPGVHFVTREWWPARAEARACELDSLRRHGARSYCHDELMLYRIARDSGLPVQDKKLNLWGMHGLHLGDIRQHITEIPQVPDAHNQVHMIEMLRDREFMGLVRRCAEGYPLIGHLFEAMQRTVGNMIGGQDE